WPTKHGSKLPGGTEVPAFRKCEVFQGQTPEMPETAGPAQGQHLGSGIFFFFVISLSKSH
ncbi:hypothetical protein OM318_23370, partial [Escherichia albertii]|nr:hypothetical protein [Escherichia albertii]MCZ9221799.1 hypothetical protein [Escherichia albertii]